MIAANKLRGADRRRIDTIEARSWRLSHKKHYFIGLKEEEERRMWMFGGLQLMDSFGKAERGVTWSLNECLRHCCACPAPDCFNCWLSRQQYSYLIVFQLLPTTSWHNKSISWFEALVSLYVSESINLVGRSTAYRPEMMEIVILHPVPTGIVVTHLILRA